MSTEGPARSQRLLEVWPEATREESDGENGFLSRYIGRLGRRLRTHRGRRKRKGPTRAGPFRMLTLEFSLASAAIPQGADSDAGGQLR
jgi:hypothetical protein